MPNPPDEGMLDGGPDEFIYGDPPGWWYDPDFIPGDTPDSMSDDDV